jgi:predicted metalloprotease with PDZ domain
MSIRYFLDFEQRKNHIISVRCEYHRDFSPSNNAPCFYLASWSPGSYLIREYVKHLRVQKVTDEKGRELAFTQVSKNRWQVGGLLDENKGQNAGKEIHVHYESYAHEWGVRHSHITIDHAFLHGPTYLIGWEGAEQKTHEVEINLPQGWNKLNTGLQDISEKREHFIYRAKDFDELLDGPIEIGNQVTDGFQIHGKNHYLAFYGKFEKELSEIKQDMKSVVQYVADYMGDLPIDDYTFITHFVPKHFGGLEHCNSTVLAFDPHSLFDRQRYLNWLSLVSHEYFHLWNVKRIRPVELGPFDYQQENYTQMLWLAEGLTSFVDDYFVYKAGLSTAEEYLSIVTRFLNRYYSIPGRFRETLEDSSFNAWTRLYRAHENTDNVSISYYLKGGLVFMRLHIAMLKEGKDIKDLIHALWKAYKNQPEKGFDKEFVYSLIKERVGLKAFDDFVTGIETTEDLDFETSLAQVGVQLEWKKPSKELGLELEFKQSRIFVKKVIQDTGAFKSGLDVGDEILAFNGNRVLEADWKSFTTRLSELKQVQLLIARDGLLGEYTVVPSQTRPQVEKLKVIAPEQFKHF